MAYTIPNAASATYAWQAGVMQADLDILAAGYVGTDVISGCAVTASGTPDGNVQVASGQIESNAGAAVTTTSGSLTPAGPDALLNRIDMVAIDGTGNKSIIAGTAAANPVPAAVPAGSVILAFVSIPAGVSVIQNAAIVDKRVINAAPTARITSGSIRGISSLRVNETTAQLTGAAIEVNGTIHCINGLLNGLAFMGTEFNAKTSSIDLRATRGTSLTSLAHSHSGDIISCWHTGGSYDTVLVDVASIQVEASQDYTTTSGSAKAVATSNVASKSGTTTIDSQALVAGDVVLLTAQTGGGVDNGPWTIQTGAWTRPASFSSGSSQPTQIWFITNGTGTNAQSFWTLTGTITVDTNAETWTVTAGSSGSRLTGYLTANNTDGARSQYAAFRHDQDGTLQTFAGLVANNNIGTAPVGILDGYAFAATGVTLNFFQSKGSKGSPGQTVLNDKLGVLSFRGYNSVDAVYVEAARINVTAVEAFNHTQNGAFLSFLTTITGTLTEVEVMRITSTSGPLGIVEVSDQLAIGGGTVGGSNAPNAGTALDVVTGLAAFRQQSLTLVNGANTNVTLPTSSLVFITGPSGSFSINGFAGKKDGMHIRFVYLGAQQLTITNQATSTAANQINTLTGADVVFTTSLVPCTFDLDYDSGSQKWILTNTRTKTGSSI